MLTAGAATGDLSVRRHDVDGREFLNDKKYAEAADAFQRVTDKSPYDRFALFNLANSQLA